MKRFLAFDLGASSGRAILGAWNGDRLECETIYTFPNEPQDVHGSTYWDILRLFHEVKQGLQVYATRCGPHLDGIGLDTWGVDFALIDGDGRLLANPHHHRDTRFANTAEPLHVLVDGMSVYQRTGVHIERVSTINQLYALAVQRSPVLQAANRLLMIPGVLHWMLTGELMDEHSNVSNTGLIDCQSDTPLEDVFRRIGVPPAILPPVVRPGHPFGALLPDVRRAAGLHATSVYACATHDTASAVLSAPAVPGEQWAFLICGTWSVLGVETSQPITTRDSYEASLTTAATADGRSMTRCNLTGLWIVQELRRIWSRNGATLDYGAMVEMAAIAAPFAGFIDVNDPRFVHPADMEQALLDSLRLSGQPLPDDRPALLRVVFESLALKYRITLSALCRATGIPVDVVHLVGGGVKNRLLCQFTADALGIPVLAGPVEATAMGNLMMQMRGAGLIGSVQEGREALRASADITRYEPDNPDAWACACARYQEVMRRMGNAGSE